MENSGFPSYVVATDVGGTCTDTVVVSGERDFAIGKALSTPPNFATGVVDSLTLAAAKLELTVEALLERTSLFIHGSTVVDNTLFTRDGVMTGLITTAGFEDALLVTRGAYGRWAGLPEEKLKHPVATDRPVPLVAAGAILGVRERVDFKGDVLEEMQDEEVEATVRALLGRGVRSIAVCFLWSFYNDRHERRVRDLIRKIAPDCFVTLSSEVAGVPGEYERASTAVINSYTGPIAKSYVDDLKSLLGQRRYTGPLMVMQGYGGLLRAEEAVDRPVGMLECGPAAGVIGSKALGDLMGDRDIIAADMGGTTFKVGVIQNGEIEYAREPLVDRYHYIAPKMEVVSIGAGGGSIVSIDPHTGIPRLGPRSAGAFPGPVCYGRGGREVTLTDALTLIGFMDPDRFLGGSMKLDLQAARTAFREQIADPLGMSVEDAAIGIYRIATAQITDLIHEITVERGLDPRDYVLHAFGGSCGMVCAMFGAELSVRRIVVPYTASVNCAFGLVSADIVHEYATARVLPATTDPAAINAIFAPLVERATRQLAAEGFEGGQIRLDWSIDMRYSRQVHDVTTPVRGAVPVDRRSLERLVDDFEVQYANKYGQGSGLRAAGIDMTLFRLTARALMKPARLASFPLAGPDASSAKIGTRPVFVVGHGVLTLTSIYDFDKLQPGNEISGPAVIHTPITTIVVQDAQRARVDCFRNVVIEFTGQPS